MRREGCDVEGGVTGVKFGCVVGGASGRSAL